MTNSLDEPASGTDAPIMDEYTFGPRDGIVRGSKVDRLPTIEEVNAARPADWAWYCKLMGLREWRRPANTLSF